ncbi:MAG: helix-turn-helix transcriptional regulator [Pseudomonadota bacterium]
MTADGIYLSAGLSAPVLALALIEALRRHAAPRLTLTLFIVFSISISAFISQSFLELPALWTRAFEVVAGASCGLSWLLTRSLFQTPNNKLAALENPGGITPSNQAVPLWCWTVVALIFTSHLFVVLLATYMESGLLRNELQRTFLNINLLASSVALLLALIEPISSGFARHSSAEKRFRLRFTSGYALLLGLSVVWLGGAPDTAPTADLTEPVRVACAFFALIGFGAAVLYRSAHPLPKANSIEAGWSIAPKPNSTAYLELKSAGSLNANEGQQELTNHAVRAESGPSAADRELAHKLLTALGESHGFRNPELKVEHLARQLNEKSYRITQAISSATEYRNFNQMVNSYRLNEAACALRSPQHANDSILSIALASGFNSIGPFNRAFKQRFGLTPSQYRLSTGSEHVTKKR